MAAAAAKLWLTPPAGVDNQGLQRTIADRLPGGADHPGYTVRLLEVTTTYLESRRVTLSLTMAAGQTAEQVQGYAADILALVQELNADEAAGIAVLRFDAFDAGGRTPHPGTLGPGPRAPFLGIARYSSSRCSSTFKRCRRRVKILSSECSSVLCFRSC
jgi:hypothetical protein